ncbi:hypothetical protein XENTR_v10009846 [Xenopus tropicalis]|nr:hypothetical protein XENTR_v10009846 [Xenopus tropicalis]|eukprot:XP_004919366.1 PREDICTED: CD209 antigen-like protein C [Xenopus tropicalis]
MCLIRLWQIKDTLFRGGMCHRCREFLAMTVPWYNDLYAYETFGGVFIDSALSAQMLELQQNNTETKNELLSVQLNAPVKMEERLMAEITKLKNPITRRQLLSNCPENWQGIESKCYYISTTTLTWEESKNVCIAQGSSLLILKDKKEMDDLEPLVENKPFWIGMTKKGKSWQWLDSTIPTFLPWAPNEPNDMNGKENCAESNGRQWNDIDCLVKGYYICKKNL